MEENNSISSVVDKHERDGGYKHHGHPQWQQRNHCAAEGDDEQPKRRKRGRRGGRHVTAVVAAIARRRGPRGDAAVFAAMAA